MVLNKIALAAGLVAVAGVANAATLIDNFDSAALARTAPPALTNDAFGTTTTGYTRTLTTTASGNFVDTAINSVTNPGKLSHSQGAGVTGSSLVTYALGGIDLTEGGMSNAFRIQLDSVDLFGILGVVVNGTATKTLTTDSLFIQNGGILPSYADFLFSDFAGVNFTSVNSVSFLIDGTNTAALDATIDNFGTVCSALTDSGGSGATPRAGSCAPAVVPEPGSMGLIGLAILGLGLTRRFAKKA